MKLKNIFNFFKNLNKNYDEKLNDMEQKFNNDIEQIYNTVCKISDDFKKLKNKYDMLIQFLDVEEIYIKDFYYISKNNKCSSAVCNEVLNIITNNKELGETFLGYRKKK